MKKSVFNRLLLATITIAMFAITFTSCEKEKTTTQADKTALEAKIAECETLANAATTADYPEAAITAFKTVIAGTKTLAASVTLTQTQADNAVVALDAAKEIFLASAFGAIPKEALLLGLTFEEAVTNNQIITAGKGLVATLKAGPSEIFAADTQIPSIVSDRDGKVMYFTKGGHLDISDYNQADFMGKTLSISVWVKPEYTRAGNYIASLNYWNTWKLQIQENNKPFFTAHTNLTATEEGWTDADNQNDNSAPNGSWTHIVVTSDLTSRKLTFYVNGALSMEWTETTKPGFGGTFFQYAPADGSAKLPLLIGACTTYSEANASWTWGNDWKTPANWDSFVGHMDNLQIYNIALTEGQVSKLYNDEK